FTDLKALSPPMSTPIPTTDRSTNRRVFLRDGSLLLLAAGAAARGDTALLAADSPRRVRLGMVTDLHYADKAPAGSRYYRETLDKLAEAAEQFERDQPDFVVSLGDFIDEADS